MYQEAAVDCRCQLALSYQAGVYLSPAWCRNCRGRPGPQKGRRAPKKNNKALPALPLGDDAPPSATLLALLVAGGGKPKRSRICSGPRRGSGEKKNRSSLLVCHVLRPSRGSFPTRLRKRKGRTRQYNPARYGRVAYSSTCTCHVVAICLGWQVAKSVMRTGDDAVTSEARRQSANAKISWGEAEGAGIFAQMAVLREDRLRYSQRALKDLKGP